MKTAVLFDLGDVLVHLRFERGLARELEVEVPFEKVAAAWRDIFDPWPEMEALAGEVLDAGHPAYLLSNTDPVHFELLEGKLPLLARFGLSPADCAYLDDRPDNVTSAAGVGIPGLVFTGDLAAARAFLRSRGVAI